MRGSRGQRPAPAPRRPRPAAPDCHCGGPDWRSRRVGARAPQDGPLPSAFTPSDRGRALGGSHPRRGPGLRPPPRPIEPGAQGSGRRARSAWAPSFSLQSLIKAAFIYPGFFALRVHSLSKQQDGDRANLQSAVVFRKTVYTPLARPPLLLGGPSPLQLRLRVARKARGAPGRPPWLSASSEPGLRRPTGGWPAGGTLSRRSAHAAPPAAADGWETVICL